MDPSIKKLPKSVQSLACAANQINSYRKAVQELVFNSLDADATSIAVRVNITDGSIQVVDNGCGISKLDIKLIGQMYMTSKFVDSKLKSAPNKYGFQGQSLANLAQISETLKVISRYHKCETTWIKAFENGKEKLPAKWNPRPSKGTTIEIKGFLHNLSIQRKSVNSISELQNIKIFLEHLSIVHSSISLSLRDDSKNEIVYQIHKNRDMYQTLSTLYGIEMADVQELQVEKNQYKVKAYVGKRDVEIDKHFIFLNGKCIPESSAIAKKVNDNFKKHFKGNKKKLKKNVNNDEETHVTSNSIPFYFIFITCPYLDYEMTNSVLEFKDWEQINLLLDKLIKFYTGDIQLKVAKNPIRYKTNKLESESTRNRIESIMHKILGNHCKKTKNFQMQNGVKGKFIRRKPQRMKTTSIKHKYKAKGINTKKNNENDESTQKLLKKKRVASPIKKGPRSESRSKPAKYLMNDKNRSMTSIPIETNPAEQQNMKNEPIQKVISKHKTQKKIGPNKKPCKKNICLNSKFANATESVKKRCELLVQTIKEIFSNNEQSPKEFRNESEKHTHKSFVTNDRNISVRAIVDEVIIREYIPLRSKQNLNQVNKTNDSKQFKSTYDLLQPASSISSQHNNEQKEWITPNIRRAAISKPYRKCIPWARDLESPYRAESSDIDVAPLQTDSRYQNNDQNIQENTPDLERKLQTTEFRNSDSSLHPMSTQLEITERIANYSSPPFQAVTFQSHNYENIDKKLSKKYDDTCNFVKKQRNFITTQSRDNFVDSFAKIKICRKRRQYLGYSRNSNHIKKHINRSAKVCNIDKIVRNHESESNTIEFTESNVYHSMTQQGIRHGTFDLTNFADNTIETITPTINYIHNDHKHKSISPVESQTNLFTRTYNCDSSEKNKTLVLYNDENAKSFETHTILSRNHYILEDAPDTNYVDRQSTDDVFVSKTQENQITNPLDVCETILQDQELTMSKAREFDISFNWSNGVKLNDNGDADNSQNESNDVLNAFQKRLNQDNFGLISHHFSKSNRNSLQSIQSPIIKASNNEIMNSKEQKKETTLINDNLKVHDTAATFNIKNRLFFVPKGMSTIFNDCNIRPIPDKFLENIYYEDKIYNDFVDKVQNDVEIFKPRIEAENTAKDSKASIKLKKTNAYLKFDGMSLRNAYVLGQVDGKFITAILKGKSEDTGDFLVLFDQHAVHERIRLENNLADYLSGSLWKPVTIDEVSLNMTKDDILYLHNYKEKFSRFGLEWRIHNNNELTITAIPEGILGKNLRQVEKIIKAVKNLIKEEINNIKLQRGCVSLYPKSIMYLVFSEACRYAIKFGDLLSKSRCKELLKQLANCKTPFQCAHGRPAMAVIMNVEEHKLDYKINFNKLLEFKSKMKF